MRNKQKQKAPQSALETLLLVLLAALTLVPLFLVVQNSFKSRFYISGDPFVLPNKETFVALENYISGLSAGGFFAALHPHISGCECDTENTGDTRNAE